MKKVMSIVSILAIAVISSGAAVGLNQNVVLSESMKMAQADDQYLMEVNTLLKENREVARQIAAKLKIESSSTTPGTGNLQFSCNLTGDFTVFLQ